MAVKRFRRSKDVTRTLDEYESTSSSDSESSDLDFQRPDLPTLRSSSRKSAHIQQGQNVHTRTQAARPRRATVSSNSDILGSDLNPKIPKLNSQKDTRSKLDPTGSKKAKSNNTSSAYEIKKHELQVAQAAEMCRQNTIRTLCDRITSRLLSQGDISRDVAHVCSNRFKWDFREWKDILKGGQVTIYESFETDNLNTQNRLLTCGKKRRSHGLKEWDPALEIDGITLCILKSGGVRVSLPQRLGGKRSLDCQSAVSPVWDIIENCSELRCLFVHRAAMKKFFSQKKLSLADLTQLKPRLHIFAFGNGEETAPLKTKLVPDPRVELIFRAGTIIIPTFDSLFRNNPGYDQSGKVCFDRLKHLCLVNPFVQVCLHPSMQIQLDKSLSLDKGKPMIDINFLIDFLVHPFDSPEDAAVSSLGDWIQLDRNNICWLWSEDDQASDHENYGEEPSEISSIVKSMKKIRDELYKVYRRFMIVLSEEHPYSNQTSIAGIELVKVSQLTDSFSNDLA